MSVARTFVPVLLCLSLLACQSLSVRESEIKLRNTLRLYEDIVRWRELDKAYALTQGATDEPVVVPDGLENVRVMSYDEVSAPSKISDELWTQTVTIEYVLTDRQVVRTIVDTQSWKLNLETGSWYRANPIPEFR